MNERIKQLAERATVYREGLVDGKYDIEFFDKEKFAELIIKECGQVAWRHTPDFEELDYSHLIKDKILEHFGVEE